MKTRNMPRAKYYRRVVAFERLEAAKNSGDNGVSRYAKSHSGEHEFKVLDERIKDYASLGQRPSRTMGGV